MGEAAQNPALEAWLAGALGARAVTLRSLTSLTGGAIQDNLLATLEVDGRLLDLVLRKDASATIAASRSRREEFALLRAAHEAGVTVPRPVAFCDDPGVLGGPFAAMERVPGEGFGPRIVKDSGLGGDRAGLARRLGEELARIHAVDPAQGTLAFLGPPPERPAQVRIDRMRASLDAMGEARPELEWGLRWAEIHAPPPAQVTLCHNDFRTGNYMVDATGLTAILDWEFAGWGDPVGDLGWFTARCWRFSRPDLEAGGIAPRAPFYEGYEAASGRAIDHEAVLFWEVMTHLGWAVIALEQGFRHRSGAEPSLALALTGRMAAELEHEILELTQPARWSATHAR